MAKEGILDKMAAENLAALEERRKEFEKTLIDFRKDMTEKSKKIFHDYLKAYFEAYPKVNAIYWTQYTPYFNDGDTCEFGIHDVFVRYGFDEQSEHGRNSPDEDTTFWDDDLPENLAKLDWQDQDKLLDPVKKPINKLIHGLGDDVMEGLFGDHASIYANRYGVFVEEYDHD